MRFLGALSCVALLAVLIAGCIDDPMTLDEPGAPAVSESIVIQPGGPLPGGDICQNGVPSPIYLAGPPTSSLWGNHNSGVVVMFDSHDLERRYVPPGYRYY